jgi:prephenate dehydrogenase
MPITLAIVGVGLIGGSIALAARSRRLAARIIGVGPSSSHLESARRQGMLDEWHNELEPAVRDADVVVVCTPVDQIANVVFEAVAYGRQDTMVTDVGSTKAVIVKDLIGQLRQGSCFVAGHPLAGSEKSGPQFADVRLFENRVVVLTPHEWFAASAVDLATAFWQGLGARVKVMSPDQHDKALAITSHLPHLVAAALASTLPAELHELAASGFRDTTRVAGGDPQLWASIFCQNSNAVMEALAMLQSAIDQFSSALAPEGPWGLGPLDPDRLALLDLLTRAKRNRDALGS